MLNTVTLQGNLGSAPHFKKTQKGEDMASFSLATSYSWKDENGEWNKHVDWHQVRIYKESTIRWMKDILRKGDAVKVEGKLTYKKRKDKLGRDHVEAQVVVSKQEGSVELVSSPHAQNISTNDSKNLDPNTPVILSERAPSEADLSFENSTQPIQPEKEKI